MTITIRPSTAVEATTAFDEASFEALVTLTLQTIAASAITNDRG